MRHLIVVLVLSFGLQLISAQEAAPPPTQESSRRPPVTLSDALAAALWHIAVVSHVPIGFESAEQTIIPAMLNQVPTLGGWTLTQVLDAVVAADDRYEWRAMAGMIVVRPKSAWTDAANPLNRQVRNLQASGVSPNAVLIGLRNFLYSNRFVVPGLSGDVSLHVDSGTVLDVLDRLVLASDQAMWVASYRKSNAQPDDGRWGVRFELRNANHATAVAASRPSAASAER